jgi:D-glycero-beta-D-manno-heptose-7-phosphate kinase
MPARDRLLRIIEQMQQLRVVVYGDLVADRFIHGVPKRISREAPVLILRQEREDLVLGGAGNAINNIRTLGGIPYPVSFVGADSVSRSLVDLLGSLDTDVSSILTIDRYHTPTKTRILGGMPHSVRQQIVRFDREEQLELRNDELRLLESRLQDAITDADAILISDYGYGVVSPHLVPLLTTRSEEIPVTLDSRYDLLRYQGITAATPNEEEAAAAAGVELFGDDEDQLLREAGQKLRKRLACPALLITRGSRGMALFEESEDPLLIPVYGTDQIADVTGAGDTVIATFTLALAAGASCSDAAHLANYAGGIVVMKMGTATVGAEELARAVEDDR